MILQYSRHMGFRGAKSILGLMVMALAFSMMAPANAVTPGQVCVRTPSGIAISTTVQWLYDGNRSRVIATDANGCVNFPHLPQDDILIDTSAWLIKSGSVYLENTYANQFSSHTVTSSGQITLISTSNPPEVKYSSLTIKTNSNKAVNPFEWLYTSANSSFSYPRLGHEYYSDSDRYDLARDWGSWFDGGSNTWNLFKCDEESVQDCLENPSRKGDTFWIDESGTAHFYYVGELAKDTRDLTQYDPDTDQTITLPEAPRAPFVAFDWYDSRHGLRSLTYPLTTSNQTINLLQMPVVKGIPKKPIRFKSGQAIKVKLTLLDSYGKPFKNQWVWFEDDGSLKISKKCKVSGKTDKKGKVTLTLCPKKSGYAIVRSIDPIGFWSGDFEFKKKK